MVEGGCLRGSFLDGVNGLKVLEYRVMEQSGIANGYNVIAEFFAFVEIIFVLKGVVNLACVWRVVGKGIAAFNSPTNLI